MSRSSSLWNGGGVPFLSFLAVLLLASRRELEGGAV